jgi:hypothetical protein
MPGSKVGRTAAKETPMTARRDHNTLRPTPEQTPPQGRTVEYGLRDPDGTIWPVPEYVTARGVDPLVWATRVAAAEGQTVVTRTVTVTEWVTPEKADDGGDRG